MPTYEYRCSACGAVTSVLLRVTEHTRTRVCDHCGAEAHAIVSRPSVHLSKQSKLDRLDPKYDKMVDRAMKNTPNAEPDRLLKKLKPFPKD